MQPNMSKHSVQQVTKLKAYVEDTYGVEIIDMMTFLSIIPDTCDDPLDYFINLTCNGNSSLTDILTETEMATCIAIGQVED